MRKFMLGLVTGILLTGSLAAAGQLAGAAAGAAEARRQQREAELRALQQQTDDELRRGMIDLQRSQPPVFNLQMYRELVMASTVDRDGVRLIRLIAVPGILLCGSESGSHPLIEWISANPRFVELTMLAR